MRTYLITSTLVAACFGALLAIAHAQPANEGPTPSWVADAGPASVAAPVAVEPAPDLLKEAGEVKRTALELRSAPTLAAVMAFIAALALLLCHLLKAGLRARKPGGWWKKWIPRFAGLLGVIAAGTGAYTGDMMTAILYGFVPPLMVWFHQVYSTTKDAE